MTLSLSAPPGPRSLYLELSNTTLLWDSWEVSPHLGVASGAWRRRQGKELGQEGEWIFWDLEADIF